MAVRQRRPRIGIVGAGVSGLSVGLCLLETYGIHLDVTIMAEKFSPDTTSDHAGAVFIAVYVPFFVSNQTMLQKTGLFSLAGKPSLSWFCVNY